MISHPDTSDNSSRISIELVITVRCLFCLMFFAMNTAVVEASRIMWSPSVISSLIKSAIFCLPEGLDFHRILKGKSMLLFSFNTAPP